MSLEDALNANTKALEGLTAQLAKGGGGSAPVTVAESGRKPGRPKSITLDEVRAIAEKLAAKRDKPAVRELIKQHGAAQLADLDKSKYAAFIAACEVAINDDDGDGDEAEGDDSL